MNILNACMVKIARTLILISATLASHGQAVFAQQAEEPVITSSYSRALVEIGETVSVIYTIDNSQGLQNLVGLSFTDQLPAQLEHAPGATLVTTGCVRSFSPMATVSGNLLTFTYNGFDFNGFRLAEAGQTCEVSMELVAVADGTGNGDIQVTASTIPVVVGAQDSITVDEPVSISTDTIGLSKEFINDPVSAGGTTTLEFTALNVHPFESATDLAFTDDLGAMLTGVNFDPSSLAGTCGGTVIGSTVIDYSGGTIPPRSSCTISVEVTIPNGASDGLYSNTSSVATAMLDGAVVSSDVAQDRLEVTSDPLPLVVSQTISGDLTPGGSLILNFNISNPNASDATSVTLSEFYQTQIQNLTFNSVSGSCGAGSSIANQSSVPSGGFDPSLAIVLNGGTIPANASCSFSATFTLPSSYSSGTYDFTIEQASATIDGMSVASAEVTTSVELVSSINLSLTKSFASDTVVANGTVGMTFILSNTNEDNIATGVAFSDDLESFHSGAVLSSTESDNCGGSFSGTSIASYSGGTVPANGQCTIETTITVGSAASGSVTNTTSDLTAGIDGGTPSVLSDTSASDTITILSQSVPTFTAEVNPSIVLPGSMPTITYTIDNTQQGSGNIAGLALIDRVGANLAGSLAASALSSDTCGFSVASSGATLILTGGGVLANSTCTTSVVLNVGVAIPDGDYTLLPELSANVGGSGVFLTGSARVTVQSDFLQFSKSFSQPTINAGEGVNLTFTILNQSAVFPAAQMTFSDDLSAFLAGTTATNVVSNSCGGTVDIATNPSLIDFSNGLLAADSQCSITVALATSASTPASSYTNETSALSAVVVAESLNLTGDPASASLTVTQIVEPSLSIAFSPATIFVGGTTELTYTLSNPSNTATLNDLQFSNDLDAFLSGTTITSIDASACNGALSGQGSGTFLANGISIAPMADCVVTVALQTGAQPASTYLNSTSDVFQNGVEVADSASANLITQNNPPSFAKVFGVASMPQGDVTSLTFTLSNAAMPFDATGVDFTDAFPAGLLVATPSNASMTCTGGTLTAAAGGGSVAYTGGTIPAGGSCTVSLNVTSAVVGDKVNVTGDLTSAFGNSGTATDTLSISAAPVPTFTKAFGVASMPQGDVTTLTLTLSNAGALIDATGVEFQDTFPADLILATPSNASTTCTGGTLSAAAGGGVISYSNGTIPAGTSCTVVADVTSVVTGDKVNTSGALTSSLGSSGTATDTLTISAAPTPTFAKAFGVSAMEQGDVTSLTFDLGNAGALIDATDVDFVDNFPAGLVVATPNNASTTCVGGTLTAVAGSGQVSYSGGVISSESSCSVTVNVTSVTVDSLVNVTNNMTSSLGNSGTATDTLNITPAPVPSFAKEFAVSSMVQGDVTTLTLTLSNTEALIGATSVEFNDVFPADLMVATPANASTTCTGGTVTAVSGSGSVSYSGGTIGAGATCTVTVDVISSVVGNRVNVTGDLTSDLGNSGTATDTLTVTPAPTPNFAKEFAVSSIEQGDVTQLTLTLSNTGALVDATGADFTDSFPVGLTVANPANAVSTCAGGTLSATAGSALVSLADTTIPAGQECSVTVDVTSIVVDSLVNVTGNLTTSLGDSGTATDTLEVTAAPIPEFSKAFADASMPEGDVTQLTLTMSNNDALLDATDVDFTDDFPTGLFVANPANASTTCSGGTLTASPDSTSVSYSGGAIPAGESCSVSVDVTSVAVGDLVNVTGEMTSFLGNSGTATATLEISAAPVPTFSKAFSVSQMTQGEIATLTLTMANTDALIDAEDVSMVDGFPAGMTIASPSNASTTCTGGTLTADAGAGSVTYSDGTIDAGATCTVVVDVTSATVGDAVNITDALMTSLGDSGTATATLGVIAAPLPSFAKSFSPSSVILGGVSTMTLEIDSTAFIAASAVSFRDSMPAGMVVADIPNVTNTCGGSVSASSGGGLVGLSAGTLGVQESCIVTVDVVGTLEGELVNVTDDLTSSLGNSGTATGTLTVTPRTTGTLTIVQVSDEDGTFGFSSSESSLNFSITTNSGAGTFGPVELTPGAYTITQTRPARFTNVGLECNDSNSSGTFADGILNVNLDAGEDVTCTYETVNAGALSEAINSFLDRRITMMLSSEPSSSRRLDRLRKGLSGSRNVSFARGDLKSLLPFTLDTASLEQGNISFSTSVSQARDALARQDLSLDGSTTRTAKIGNERTDLWFEFQHKRYSDADGIDGKFSVGYVGFDYLISPDVLVGGIVQFDRTSESSPILSTSVEGNGFMVGPYVTARLSPTLFFDGRIAFGKSSNSASTGLIGQTDFKTNRFLVDASLIGDFKWNNWNVQPNASLSYMQEIWSIDPATGLTGEKISQGQIKVGPQFSTSFANDAGVVFQPSFGFDGIYVFGDSGSTATESHAEGMRARVQAGVGVTYRNGATFELKASYDGIGQDDYEAYGAQINLSIPFRK